MTPKILLKITERYSEPHRCYHNIMHPSSMFEQSRVWDIDLSPEQIMAIWFHDIIYDVPQLEKGMNEKKSAEFAGEILSEDFDKTFVDIVKTIILDSITAIATIKPSQIVQDLDLCVLGELGYFDSYVPMIEHEFKMLSPFDFLHGRIQFLEEFLGREFIYHTEQFQNKYEEVARINMKQELEVRHHQLVTLKPLATGVPHPDSDNK